MAQDMSSPYIDLWKDYAPEVYVESKDSTRTWGPETGISGATFQISATEQGDPIGALSGIAASHISTAPGHYVGSIDMSLLQTELSELTYPHGTDVYLQFKKSGDVEVESFRKRIRRSKYI